MKHNISKGSIDLQKKKNSIFVLKFENIQPNDN